MGPLILEEKREKLFLDSLRAGLNTGWRNVIQDNIAKSGVPLIPPRDPSKHLCMPVFDREKNIFHQLAFFEIQKSSKLKTFALIKKQVASRNTSCK